MPSWRYERVKETSVLKCIVYNTVPTNADSANVPHGFAHVVAHRTTPINYTLIEKKLTNRGPVNAIIFLVESSPDILQKCLLDTVQDAAMPNLKIGDGSTVSPFGQNHNVVPATWSGSSRSFITLAPPRIPVLSFVLLRWLDTLEDLDVGRLHRMT